MTADGVEGEGETSPPTALGTSGKEVAGGKVKAALRGSIPGIIMWGGLFVIWELGSRFFGLPAYILPSPTDIVLALVKFFPYLLENLQVTLVETLVVVLVSGMIGIAIGAALVLVAGLLPLPEMVPAPTLLPGVFATTFLVLVGTGLAAGVAPARLAARVDPAIALRVT